MIEIREVEGKGRGVFASEPIAKGTVITKCHVIPYQGPCSQNPFADQMFAWGEDGEALALGPVSFVNHSADPNCELEHDFDGLTITLVASRPIAKGQELSFHYDCPLWFKEA